MTNEIRAILDAALRVPCPVSLMLHDRDGSVVQALLSWAADNHVVVVTANLEQPLYTWTMYRAEIKGAYIAVHDETSRKWTSYKESNQ